MSEAIEKFNEVMEAMSAEVEKTNDPKKVEAIQEKYESIIDKAEEELEAAFEKEFEEEAKKIEAEAAEADKYSGFKDPEPSEKDSIIETLTPLSEKQIRVRYTKVENLEFAKILGLPVKSKLTEKEVVGIIYKYLQGLL